MNPQILNFFRECATRLRSKSPKFFVILQIIFGALAFANYIPKILDEGFGMEVISPRFIWWCEKIANICTGAVIGGFFTSRSAPAAMTQEGNVVKTIDEKKYPFTTTDVQKQSDKKYVPIVEDPLKQIETPASAPDE